MKKLVKIFFVLVIHVLQCMMIKTDHVKSPDKVTIPIHEEKEDTRTNDVVAKDGCCLVEEDSCDCEEEGNGGGTAVPPEDGPANP